MSWKKRYFDLCESEFSLSFCNKFDLNFYDRLTLFRGGEEISLEEFTMPFRWFAEEREMCELKGCESERKRKTYRVF